MNTSLTLRLLSAATAALLTFSCGSASPTPDGGTPVEDAGTGSGTDGGSDGGTGGGADAGTSGGTDAGTGGPVIGVGCTLGQDTCATGESCLLVEVTTSQFEAHCMAGGCDLVTQDCPQGQACGYTLDQATNQPVRGCIAPGNRTEGQSCGANIGQCAAGMVCAGSQGGSTCRRFCEKASDCGAGASCAFLISITGSLERPLTCEAVADQCDLLLQDCPTSTDGCYLTSIGNKCQPAGTALVGQPCGNTALCEKGASCIGTSAGPNPTFECARLCGFPAPATPACPAGTCTQLVGQNGPVLDGGVGACR